MGRSSRATAAANKQPTAVLINAPPPLPFYVPFVQDAASLENVQTMARAQFNDATDTLRSWGGGRMGLKTRQKLAKREAIRQAELNKKLKL